MALKIKLLGVLIFFTGFSLIAQYQKIPAGYRNGFYNYYHSQPDSALFYGRKLAENPEYASFLRQALHDDIFTNFLESTKEKMKEQVDKSNYTAWEEGYGKMMETCYKTVHALHSDTNDRLVKSVEPLYLFAEVQRSSHDLIKLSHLTRAFIKSMLVQKDLYQNKSATYALLIYMTIEREKKLEKLSNEFLTAIIDKLSVEQPIVNVNTSSSTQLNERAWYRYLYACANHFKANKLSNTGDKKRALRYFKTAAEYSPDLTDLNYSSAYFTEESIFSDKKKSIFYTEYLSLLTKETTNKNEILATLSNMTVRNPVSFKSKLYTYYRENFPKGEDFEIFWSKQINAKLAKAPDITIQALDGTSYSSSLRTGKWMLIDFWGTWCGPCREEHPDLQKFYLNKETTFGGKIELLTVACNDTKEKVNSYMDEFSYSFPVAMSDQKITELFNVHGFPTKILITPEGNYLKIPYGIDWTNLVKHYISR